MKIQTKVAIYDPVRNSTLSILLFHDSNNDYSTELFFHEVFKVDGQIKTKSNRIILSNLEIVDFLDAIGNKEEIAFNTSFENLEVSTNYELEEFENLAGVAQHETYKINLGANTYTIYDTQLDELANFAKDVLAVVEENVLI